MKKLIYLLASAGLLLTACIAEDSGMQEQIGEAVIIGATYEAPEAEPETRSIIENGGAFKWSASDSFNAYSTGTTTESFEDNVFNIYGYDNNNRSASATFIGYGISGRITDVAVCPATLKPTWAATSQTLTVTYPTEIAWVKGEADPYMVARGFDAGAKNLSFKNLGGIIKLTVNEIPVTASKVAVTIWGGRITDKFTVEETTESNVTYWVVNDDVTDSASSSTVTFTFTASDVDPEGMTFYVPVPVMEYSKIGFSVLNSNDEPLFSFASSEKTRTVARKQIVSFPSITFVAGGGEGSFSNVITTDSGQTGTVTLPSTTNDVYVLMNSTAGEITLVPDSEDPDSVFVTILKDATVNTLNINLPNSTVVVSGEANSNLGTVNSTTSPNTLKILKSPLTIGTATINQGNANIEGTVNSIVVASGATSDGQSAGATNQVQIFVSKDAALQTVTLNAKTDVVVEQPKDKIDVTATENKVYVIVNAEGSTATAQNGGDIYVTANANCEVTAKGVESENPQNNSTAKIEDNTQGSISTNQEDGGTISTDGAVKKAQVGNVQYETIAEAFAAAAQNHETITLLVDVTLPAPIVINDGNAYTIDMNGHSVCYGTSDSAKGVFILQHGALDFTGKGTVYDTTNDGYAAVMLYGSDEPTASNYSVVTVGKDITLAGWAGVFVNFTEQKHAYGVVVNLNGTAKSPGEDSHTKAGNAVYINGNIKDVNGNVPEFNLGSTSVVESKKEGIKDGVGIYAAGYAIWNLAGDVTGWNTAVEIRAGELNITGGTLRSLTTPTTVTPNGNGPTTVGAGVAVAQHTTKLPVTVAISGGTIEGHTGLNLVNPENNSAADLEKVSVSITGGTFNAINGGTVAVAKSGNNIDSATLSITGGTFSSDPTAFVAPGYTTSGSNPWTVIKREGAVFNLTELQAAISNGVTPIYYAGEAITEAFTLAPAAATVINGLKVNHQTVAANATTLTINGDVTLNDAEITSKAYCAVSIETGKTVTLKDCVVDGSTAAAAYSRALNINGGATVTIDGSTVKGPATAGNSRCINVIDEGAHVDIVNGSVLSVSHYAINLPSTTVNAVINVENSSVNTGWAITNIWKTGNTINLTNCTLNSVNDKTQAPDNNFSAFVFNNGDGYISSNNVVTVNNCTVSVSSPSGNLQSLISMRGNNDTIKFIGSDSTISLAENGGITYQWGQLHSTLNNTLSFDKANYDQISESIDAACVVTNTNNLYTISYVTEVYYYWDTNDGQKGTYCSLADPIVRGWISDNEYIRLEKNVTLTANLTVSLSSALHVDNYFTLTLGDYSITKGNYSIILPAGLSVKTDKHTDVFTAAEGAELVETEENDVYTYTAKAKNYVAQVGETKYATLAEAVTAAQSGDTIVILSDFTLEGNAGVTIPAGKDVTIDLNGRTIKNLVNADANSQLIVNRGTLTITDSSAGANGTMTNEIASGVHTGAWTNYNYYTNIISNFGTLTINAGNLTQVATTNISYVIDNLGANSSVTINGGSLTAGYIPIRAYNATNSVTIHGGLLSGLFDLYLQLTTTLVIDGGTFSAPTRSIIYVDAASNISISGNPVFTNGTDRKFIAFDTDDVKDASTLSVTGGTYNTDPSDYVSAGYEAVQSGNNWNVVELQGVAKIGSTCYATLAEAVAAVGTNETISLLDNVALSSSETTLHFKDKSFNINGAKTIDLSACNEKYPWWFENGTFNLSDITVTSTGHDYAVLFTRSGQNSSNGTLNSVTINSVAETALCFDESNSFTLSNVTVSQTGNNSTDWRNVAVATSGGATVTIESGSYSSENGWAVRHFSSGGNITINGGSFSGKIKAHLDKGSYSQFPAIITINGGIFTNCTLEVEHNNGDTSATIVINGGKFDCDPTAYLGAGHTATHIDNTWTVQ